MGLVLTFVKAAAAAAVVPLHSSIITRRQHHHRSSSSSSINISMPKRRRQWSKQPPLVQYLPPLLQRPQHIITTPKTIVTQPPPENNDNNNSDDDEENIDLSSAADVLRLMDSLQLPVEVDMYVSLLKECTDSRNAAQGAVIHAHIQQHNKNNKSLANRLLLMYAACGQPNTARQLFDRMPVRNIISWATMIATLSGRGSHTEALQLFVDMHAQNREGCLLGMEPTGRSRSSLDDDVAAELVFTVVLRSCARVGELGLGQQLHGLTSKMAAASGSPLVQFYAMLGCQESARKLFDRIPPPCRDAATWTCIISTYSRQGKHQEAFKVFREMKEAGAAGNSTHAFASILAGMGDEEGWSRSGRQVHADAIKVGVDTDRFVGSSLVDMYARHRLERDARRAFEAIGSARDNACWNAMFNGYLRKGCCAEAIRFLYEMKAAGVEPQESMLCQVRMACNS